MLNFRSFPTDPVAARSLSSGLVEAMEYGVTVEESQRGSRAAGSSSTVSVTSRRVGTSLLVEVEGELDLGSAPHLQDHLSWAITNYEGEVRLDLSGVDFVDCSGWRAVDQVAEALADRGDVLAIVAISPSVRRLLKIRGVSSGIALRLDPETHSSLAES